MKALHEVYSDYEDKKANVEAAESNILQMLGWELTCSVGSIWLWRKEIKGQMVYLGKESALTFVRMNEPSIWPPDEIGGLNDE